MKSNLNIVTLPLYSLLSHNHKINRSLFINERKKIIIPKSNRNTKSGLQKVAYQDKDMDSMLVEEQDGENIEIWLREANTMVDGMVLENFMYKMS